MFSLIKNYSILELVYFFSAIFVMMLISLNNYILLGIFVMFSLLLIVLGTPVWMGLILALLLAIVIAYVIHSNNKKNNKKYKFKINNLDLLQ